MQGGPWYVPVPLISPPRTAEDPAVILQAPISEPVPLVVPHAPVAPAHMGSDMQAVMVPYVAEFLGTCTVVLILASTRKFYDPMWSPAAVGFAVMVVTYTTAPASYPAGMLNPAVAVTLWLCGRLNARRAMQFASMQLFGGFFAGLLVDNYFDLERQPEPWIAPSSLGPGRPSAEASVFAANRLAEETLYTALVCLTYMCCSISARNSPKDDANQFYGMGIGAMTAAGMYAAAPFSGALLNPAAIVAFAPDYGVAAWGPGYACAQIFGAAVASSLFYSLRPEDRLFGNIMPEASTPHLFVPRLFTRMLSEFVATFTVAVTVCLCLATKTAAMPLAVGFAIIAVHCSLANVSGSHLNPSCTFALTLPGPGKKLQVPLCLVYIMMQLAGGAVAGVWAGSAALAAAKQQFEGGDSAYAETTSPSPWQAESFSRIELLTAESVFTFLVSGAALCMPVQPRPTLQGSFAAGATVIAGLASSGALANPALAFAFFVAQNSAPSLLTESSCLDRVGAEILGAVLAVVAFGFARL